MDGKFVENNNFQINDINDDFKNLNKPLDIHLMTEKPQLYFKKLSKLNVEYITFHYEAVDDVLKTINDLKKLNIKKGIAINPDTNIELLTPYLNQVDLVLVMTVIPGKGGQKFMKNQIKKVKYLNKLRKNKNLDYMINVDGGINDKTLKLLKEEDVDIIVSGSFICKSKNYQSQINKLKLSTL